jgi:hypothetical protein
MKHNPFLKSAVVAMNLSFLVIYGAKINKTGRNQPIKRFF